MTAMVASKDKQETIRQLLDKAAPSIKAVLPKHLTVERLTKVALGVTARRPELLACSPRSLVLAVMQAAELGLDVGGLLGESYLVPYGDTVQLIVGYRGLVKLARQSGSLATMEAHVVHDRDAFDLEYGLEPRLVHKPFLTGDRGAIVSVYAIARFKDGGRQADAMSRGDVDLIKARSKAGNSGPWVTDYAEMAKKTIVRRLCKYVPLSPELARALEHEAAIDEGVRSPVLDVAVFDENGVEQELPSRADIMKEKLAEKVAS